MAYDRCFPPPHVSHCCCHLHVYFALPVTYFVATDKTIGHYSHLIEQLIDRAVHQKQMSDFLRHYWFWQRIVCDTKQYTADKILSFKKNTVLKKYEKCVPLKCLSGVLNPSEYRFTFIVCKNYNSIQLICNHKDISCFAFVTGLHSINIMRILLMDVNGKLQTSHWWCRICLFEILMC